MAQNDPDPAPPRMKSLYGGDQNLATFPILEMVQKAVKKKENFVMC